MTQASQGKDVRDKMVQRVKKIGNDRREELRKMRSVIQDELKKYKKVIPADRFRVI